MNEIQPFVFPETSQEVRAMFAGRAQATKSLESCLYVVEFHGSGIKVGITNEPAERLSTHQRHGRAFGRRATRGWVTPPHVEARANERELIAFCGRQPGADPRGEYFAVPFETACAFASRLPRSRGDRVAHEAEVQAGVDALKRTLVAAWSVGGRPRLSVAAQQGRTAEHSLQPQTRVRIESPDSSPHHGRTGVLLDSGPDWRIVQLDGESGRWLLGSYMVEPEPTPWDIKTYYLDHCQPCAGAGFYGYSGHFATQAHAQHTPLIEHGAMTGQPCACKTCDPAVGNGADHA